MKHILESQEFDLDSLNSFLADAREMDLLCQNPITSLNLKEWLREIHMVSFFYEESTRTRVSFEMAARNLGMNVISTTNAGAFSSAKKGETLADTMRTLMGYSPRVIVLRHNQEGSARLAAEIVDRSGGETSIINAGDGAGQHPTQALLDLYTIKNELGRVDGITIAVGGDLLHGRTTHSLVYLLSKFPGVRFVFIAPEELRMKEGVLEYLKKHGVPYTSTWDKREMAQADVVYWTRTQRERMNKRVLSRINGDYVITGTDVAAMKSDAILMHPLPRVKEIDSGVDTDHRAKYFEQAENGLYVRMVLLCMLCGVKVRV